MKKFYSAESAHGSSSSRGFANDTIVKCFDSKSARDTYVQESVNISCKKILAHDATMHATNVNLSQGCTNAPRRFNGEYWAIVAIDDNDDVPAGFVGTVACSANIPESCIVARFYK